jgi:hypothetical protein
VRYAQVRAPSWQLETTTYLSFVLTLLYL